MKTAFIVLVISIILFFSLNVSPYGYLIKGIKGAYFDGHTSAHIMTESILVSAKYPH